MTSLLPQQAAPSSLAARKPDWEQEHLTGTTIMAVEFKDGVVVGADSRTSTGSYVANRVTDKLSPVHDRIYCCRSGSSADTQAVADIVRYHISMHATELGELPRVHTAASLFKDLVYNNKDRLMASIICAGWDPHVGGSVYSIPLGGSMHKVPVAVGGSGSTYIFGLMDSEYKENMSQQQCEAFVAKSISHAMARDGSSGGLIRLCIITKDGAEKKMIEGDKLPYMGQGTV